MTSATFDLKRERLERGLSILDLARKAGISPNVVYKLEKGGTVRPSIAKKVADVMGVKVIDVAPQLFEEAA